MSDATRCGGEFGIPIVDTSNDKTSIYYFPIVRADSRGGIEYDNYQDVLDCFKVNGVSGCYDKHAVLWSSTPHNS